VRGGAKKVDRTLVIPRSNDNARKIEDSTTRRVTLRTGHWWFWTNSNYLEEKNRHHTLGMDLQMVFFDFWRPVIFGTVGVLAGLALLGWSMPRRAKVSARPRQRY